MAVLLRKVREIFYNAQDGDVVLSKLCEEMTCLQTAFSENQFWEAFIHHVQKSIIYYKPEPAVERLMDFVANFATYSTRFKSKNEGEIAGDENLSITNGSIIEDEIIEPFLLACFTLFINLHNAREKGVRLRCCQLINKMLNLLGDEECIDEGLSDDIYKCMMIRIKDVYSPIRIQAILALYRLQEPTDEDCPVINAYLCSLERDIHHLVRKTILSKIAITRKTLPYIIERVSDINDRNRQTAFMILSEKVSIRALSIAQRIKVLTAGFQSSTVNVKKACNHMLKSWFRSCNHNIVKLLEVLDIESDPECAELAVENLLKGESLDKLKEYKKLVNDITAGTMNVSEQSLTAEKVFFWYFFSKFLKTRDDCGSLFEETIPELTNLCDFIRLYAEKNFIDSAILTAFEGAEQSEFILKYLLNIAPLLDLSDEFGKINFQTLVHDLLLSETLPLSLVNILVKCYKDVIKDEETFVQLIVETISDIKQPLTQVITTDMKDKAKKMELQLARISVDMHECNDDLECAIKQQDYQQAALLKDHISELEKQKSDIQTMLDECHEQASKRVVREEDPETKLKCLTIGTAMLLELRKRGITPMLMTLKDELFFDGVKDEDPIIRNEAVKGLGLLSYLKNDFASQHFVFFIQVIQVDYERVQITAIKIIFDLYLLYGLTNFNQDIAVEDDKDENKLNEEKIMEVEDLSICKESLGLKNDEHDNEEQMGKESTAAAEGILSILLMFLQRESAALRSVVVEGMAKLMITGRVMSVNVLTRLIVAWYNPMNHSNTQLCACFATFLPSFAFQRRENMELLEEAFLPTLRTIANAPSISPLSQIDIVNVINLFIQLTDVKNIASYRETNSFAQSFGDKERLVHDSLALKISNEILKRPEEKYVKFLCKALNHLSLSPQNTIVISDLIKLSTQMIEKLKNNRLAKNMIEKFLLYLEGHSFNNELSEIQVEQSTGKNLSLHEAKEIEDVLTNKNENLLDFTPSSVLKNHLKLKSAQTDRNRRNVSFASPPHKMQRLSLSGIDFNVN